MDSISGCLVRRSQWVAQVWCDIPRLQATVGPVIRPDIQRSTGALLLWPCWPCLVTRLGGGRFGKVPPRAL
jgi:hypothetical protein